VTLEPGDKGPQAIVMNPKPRQRFPGVDRIVPVGTTFTAATQEAANHLIASMVRKVGGFTFQELNLTIDDIRATSDAVRDACAADVMAEIERIRVRRSVEIRLEETMRAPAAPSDAAWQARWERAVASLGLPVHRMPSGAGHDAMMLHRVMPQAMLFMRGLNLGISHNPLESITNDDADLVVRAFMAMLEDLAATAGTTA
jgi:hypothetical protein